MTENSPKNPPRQTAVFKPAYAMPLRGARRLDLIVAVLLPALYAPAGLAQGGQYVLDLSEKDSSSDGGPVAAAQSETWQVIRTKGTDGAPDTKAILRVADVARSDPGLAGLMLRCGKQGVEPVIVVVEPFSPQERPKITLRVDEQEIYFEGTPLQNGNGLRIPADGLDLVKGPWKGARELTINISYGGAKLNGVVGLNGVSDAIESLGKCEGK